MSLKIGAVLIDGRLSISVDTVSAPAVTVYITEEELRKDGLNARAADAVLKLVYDKFLDAAEGLERAGR